jgi:hypothetical protein
VVDKFGVEIFYGAPTALRALMREGDEWVHKTSRRSLRLLGSVGEPINPRSLGMVSQGGGRRPLPDRRHLVADRNRRRDDHAPARRHGAEAGVRHAPDVRRSLRWTTPTARSWTGRLTAEAWS